MCHGCRKAAKSPRCVVVCLCVGCGSVLERKRLGVSPSHRQPLQGAGKASCSCAGMAAALVPRHGRGWLSLGLRSKPRLPGAVRDLSSVKVPCRRRAGAAGLSAPAELQSRRDCLGEGCSRRQWALCCAKLSWFGATGPSYCVTAPRDTAGRLVGFGTQSPEFCKAGCPEGSIVP